MAPGEPPRATHPATGNPPTVRDFRSPRHRRRWPPAMRRAPLSGGELISPPFQSGPHRPGSGPWTGMSDRPADVGETKTRGNGARARSTVANARITRPARTIGWFSSRANVSCTVKRQQARRAAISKNIPPEADPGIWNQAPVDQENRHLMPRVILARAGYRLSPNQDIPSTCHQKFYATASDGQIARTVRKGKRLNHDTSPAFLRKSDS